MAIRYFKNLFLVFVFVPVIMAYSAAGDMQDAPVFKSLALIAFGVSLLGYLAKKHADDSNQRIVDQYQLDIIRHWRRASFRKANEIVSALDMFMSRGQS